VGEVLRVDQTALREAQPHFTAVASEIHGPWTSLDDALNAEGAGWDADDTGQSCAWSYLPAWSTLRQVFTDLHDEVESIAEALSTVAERAAAVDDRAGARFRARSG
jgi:hypothetical protein